MADRQIEVAPAGPAAQRQRTVDKATRLRRQLAAAVTADHGRVDPVQFTERNRLREVARRHLDLGAARSQPLNHRRQHEHVRRIC